MREDFGTAWALVWLALAALTLLGRRWWLPMAALAIPAAWLGEWEMASGQAVLIAWVALIIGTTTGDGTRYCLRMLVISVYLFGTLNKLSLHYLSGATIDDRHVPPPEAIFATVGVLLEGFMVWAVWKRHWLALPVAVALHVGIAVTMATIGWYEFAVLGAFSATMIVLVWATTRPAQGPARIAWNAV